MYSIRKYIIQIFIAGLLFITLNQWLVDDKFTNHTIKKSVMHILEMMLFTLLFYFIIIFVLKKRIEKLREDQLKVLLIFTWAIVLSIILIVQHK